MNQPIHRRDLLRHSLVAAAGASVSSGTRTASADALAASQPAPRRFKLGTVTYMLAAEWDLPTLIQHCKEIGLAAVEFRTTHKHGVEPSLNKEQRQEVKKRCADGGLVIWSLGSVCEFHSPDPAVVTRNIEDCKKFIDLAHDIGAKGVKVRPNGLPPEVSEEKTLEQIGRSIRTCAEAGASMGIEIWCEVHGSLTQEPRRIRKIMDVADHPNAGLTWNSNPTDVVNGSVKETFELLRHKIRSCHINDLITGYPYHELFTLFREMGYDRYTLIEIQALQSKNDGDAVRFARYYKALWEELSRPS